jgi:hypothetical protein
VDRISFAGALVRDHLDRSLQRGQARAALLLLGRGRDRCRGPRGARDRSQRRHLVLHETEPARPRVTRDERLVDPDPLLGRAPERLPPDEDDRRGLGIDARIARRTRQRARWRTGRGRHRRLDRCDRDRNRGRGRGLDHVADLHRPRGLPAQPRDRERLARLHDRDPPDRVPIAQHPLGERVTHLDRSIEIELEAAPRRGCPEIHEEIALLDLHHRRANGLWLRRRRRGRNEHRERDHRARRTYPGADPYVTDHASTLLFLAAPCALFAPPAGRPVLLNLCEVVRGIL